MLLPLEEQQSFGVPLLGGVLTAYVGLAAVDLGPGLDLGPQHAGFFFADLDSGGGDGVGDDPQHARGDRLAPNLERALERVDRVDEVDIEVVNVDELLGHPDKPFVTDLANFAVLDHGIHDDLLAKFLDLGLVKIGVPLADDFWDQHLVRDLWV